MKFRPILTPEPFISSQLLLKKIGGRWLGGGPLFGRIRYFLPCSRICLSYFPFFLCWYVWLSGILDWSLMNEFCISSLLMKWFNWIPSMAKFFAWSSLEDHVIAKEKSCDLHLRGSCDLHWWLMRTMWSSFKRIMWSP